MVLVLGTRNKPWIYCIERIPCMIFMDPGLAGLWLRRQQQQQQQQQQRLATLVVLLLLLLLLPLLPLLLLPLPLLPLLPIVLTGLHSPSNVFQYPHHRITEMHNVGLFFSTKLIYDSWCFQIISKISFPLVN